MINTDSYLSRTVSELLQLLFKFCPLFVFSPFVGLGAMYDVYLRLIGKRVVDFLLVLIELFAIGFTAEALRANID